MAIFTHKDDSGDEVEVLEGPRHGELSVNLAADGASYVNIPRADARRLRDALNRWLDEQQRNDPDPAGRNTAPPYEALIRRAVAEEVARVLPLHQSPQAAEPVLVEHRPQECPGAECPEYATNTGLRLCTIPECNTPAHSYHAEHDPEPKAVGHPEAPGVDWRDRVGVSTEYCHSCGHSWSRHGVGAGDCNVMQTKRDGRFDVCGCESIRPGCGCGHAWTDHGSFGIRGCEVAPCECSAAKPRSAQ